MQPEEQTIQQASGVTYDTDRIVTVPNLLSLLRLLGVPLFLWLILYLKADIAALIVLMIAGFTDWLDGYLARTWHQTSRLGQMLDPVADRLYILATLLGLAIRDIVPWWLVAALVGRDVVLACVVPFLKTRGYTSLPVHFLGKAATFCLLYAFPLVMLGSDDGLGYEAARIIGWAFAGWGTALYWWAGLLYIRQTWTLLREMPRVTA